MKKLMALLMTLAMMSTFSCTALATNESAVGGTAFEPKGGDGKVRIGVISDTHIYSEATAEVFENALRAFKTVADDGQGNIDLSGLLLNGDIVYQFTPGVSESTSVTDVIYDYVQGKIDAQFPNGAPETVWVMGNHEFPQATNDATLTADAKTYFKDKTGCYGEDLDNPDEIRYVSQFGAYTVITAAAEDYYGALSAETEAWILETIAAEAALDPKLPIFLALHHPLDGTVYGSGANSGFSISTSAEFIESLKDYPQVINITSHVHPAPQNPMTIYQAVKETETGVSGFTSVCTPYTGSVGSLDVEGTNQTSSPNFAMMIEIDEMNVVSIYKMDLTTGKYVGEPWVIDVPALVEGNAEDYHYTNARTANANAPAFPANASVAVSNISGEGATIEFVQATNVAQDEYAQDGFVEYYNAKIYNAVSNAPVSEIKIASGYHLADTVEEMADTVSGTITGLGGGTEYIVKIYPVSPFGKEGEPIETSFTTLHYHEIPNDYALSLIPVTESIAKNGTTSLGSKSVGFHSGNTIDFEVYAPEKGWYDVGVNATGFQKDTVKISVIANGASVNNINVEYTDAVDESNNINYFANPTDFWNAPGADSYGLGANYGAEQTVVLPHENHVWLYEGKNIIRLKGKSGSLALHKAIFRKVTGCTDDPNAKILYSCRDYKMAYTGYGTSTRKAGISRYDGGGSIPIAEGKQLAAYEVSAPTAGYYNLTLNYANGLNSDAVFDIHVNSNSEKALDSVACEPTGGFSIYAEKNMGRVYLNEGVNLLTFTQQSGMIYFLNFILELAEAKTLPQPGKSTLPVMLGSAFHSADGTALPLNGYVDSMNFGGGAWVEYTVNIAEAGKYNFMRKGGAAATGLYTVYVNGEQQLKAANPSYSDNDSIYKRGEDKLGELYLNKGKNVIKVANSVSQAFIDNITLARADAKMYISGDCVSEVASGDITAKMALNGDMAVGSKANCIFAIYEDGKLVGIDSESKVLETLYDEFTATISGVTVQNDKIYTAKAFLWNDSYNGKQIVLDAE